MSAAMREHLRWAAVIGAFVAVAVAVAGYLLTQQRLQLPFADRYRLEVVLPSAEGLTADTGQPVSVAGVPVGEVVGVRVRAGRAVVALSLDPERLPRVHADGRAALVPITPLKNMEVDLDPGTARAPVLRSGATIDVGATTTTPDVDEVLAALDADTRAALQQLIGAARRGLDDRGDDLADALDDLGPSAAQLRRITAGLRDRDGLVRQLVHDLSGLGARTAIEAPRIHRALAALDGTLDATGDESARLRAGLRALPAVLADARRTVDRTAQLTGTAVRTARALRPAVRELPGLARDGSRLLRTAEPVLRRDVRPLVRTLTPLARDARPTLARVRSVTPPVRRVLSALEYGFNELVADPGDGRRGYLHWGSWFFHNANSMLSTGDAAGSPWRLLPMFDCGALTSDAALSGLLQPVLGPLTGGCRP